MTVQPTPMAAQPALLQAHREVAVTRDAPRRAWRVSQLALLLAELWLLVAVLVTQAGEATFGLLFAGTAVLWVLIAGVEAYETHGRSIAQKPRRQVGGRAIPSHS